jgi:hypothetical protein
MPAMKRKRFGTRARFLLAWMKCDVLVVRTRELMEMDPENMGTGGKRCHNALLGSYFKAQGSSATRVGECAISQIAQFFYVSFPWEPLSARNTSRKRLP